MILPNQTDPFFDEHVVQLDAGHDHLELHVDLPSVRLQPVQPGVAEDPSLSAGSLTMVGTVTAPFKPLRLWLPQRLEERVKICRIDVIVGERSTSVWLSRRPKPGWALRDAPLYIPVVNPWEKIAVNIHYEAVALDELAMGFVGQSRPSLAKEREHDA